MAIQLSETNNNSDIQPLARSVEPLENEPTKMAENSEVKRCPYCAEVIQRIAIVCKRCGRDLVLPSRTQTSGKVSSSQREALDKAVNKYAMYGFHIQSRSDDRVLMQRRGDFDWSLFIGIVLLIWPMAAFYVLAVLAQRYKVELSVYPDGKIVEIGNSYYDLQRDRERMSKVKNVVWVLVILTFLFFCFAGLLAG